MENQEKELHRIVSICVIHKNGEYLIIERSWDKKVLPGRWVLPGGGLSTDDYVNRPPTTQGGSWYYTLENSLRREIMEEVGIEIGLVSYLLDKVFIRPDKIPVLVLSFHAPWESGEVKLNSESIDFAWASLEETKNYDLVEGTLEEIEMVDKILNGKDPSTVKFGK